jgi:hypothetical protein
VLPGVELERAVGDDVLRLCPVVAELFDGRHEGESLVVSKGEKFFADEPVVQAMPAQFRAVAE